MPLPRLRGRWGGTKFHRTFLGSSFWALPIGDDSTIYGPNGKALRNERGCQNTSAGPTGINGNWSRVTEKHGLLPVVQLEAQGCFHAVFGSRDGRTDLILFASLPSHLSSHQDRALLACHMAGAGGPDESASTVNNLE